jgi:hypothetical protein
MKLKKGDYFELNYGKENKFKCIIVDKIKKDNEKLYLLFVRRFNKKNLINRFITKMDKKSLKKLRK